MICTTNCTLTTARIDAKSKFNTIFFKNCIDNSEICKIIVVWGITTMNNYKFLEKLGFSSNEAKVYGTLIKHKVLNGYEIAKLSGVARSLVYEVINRLVAKGAVIRIDGEPNFYKPIEYQDLIRSIKEENESERWHVVYLVPAIIGFVMSLFALLFARETNAFLTKRIEYLKTPIEEREQRSKEGREQNAQGGILTAVKFAFRHRQLRFLIIACCCFYLASLGTATYSTVMAKSALMTEEEITLALFLYPVGNALFTLISGFVSDKFGRKVTIVAMSCSALTCYLLFIFSGMFKWTPYLTGFAIGGFMGSYWGAGDTIGGIMFSESTPTNLRSSVTVINTLLNGVMGGLATVITMILLPIIPERMFGYMYLGLTVPGLVGAIVIMWLFVGETRGLDLKTVTGTEWDKPKKVKEE